MGDYNNDGHEDLFITYWGQNVLYRNNGNGTFTDVTKEAGLLQRRYSLGVRVHLRRLQSRRASGSVRSQLSGVRRSHIPKPGDNGNCTYTGAPVFCGPRGLKAPAHQFLYRNNGDGTFTDVSVASGIARAKGSYAMTARRRRFRQRWLAGHFCRLRFHAQPLFPQ